MVSQFVSVNQQIYKVLINNKYISVKDWYRDNLQLFQQIKAIPTSEQIGVVLRSQGFNRTDSETEVIYK
jgi:hypothetical protein